MDKIEIVLEHARRCAARIDPKTADKNMLELRSLVFTLDRLNKGPLALREFRRAEGEK